jgi:4-hydroxy-3-methylbut-2-en-1-yl diphosphate reductase
MTTEFPLVVAAPLGVEAYAVRRGLPGGAVVRAGMRGRRAGRVARALGERNPAALAVAGVAGALVPGPVPGDLVVPTEVRSAAGAVPCPSAAALADALRGHGLTVHTGPVVSVDHVVHGAERARLAATGAVAVDMESAALLATADGRPRAVVRAVVDTPGRPLLHPATLPGGVAALRSLAALGPALVAWARAVTGQAPVEPRKAAAQLKSRATPRPGR